MKIEGKLRCIVLADIHWGASDPDLLNHELNEVFFPYLEENANETDLVVLDGDLLHRKLSFNEKAAILCTKFMVKLVRTCHENNIKVRIIRGTRTHDFNQLENFKQLELDYDFRIYNTVDFEEIFPNVTALFLPEEYMENPNEYYKEFTENLDAETKYDLIFGHGTWDFASFEDQQQESERNIKGAPVFQYKEWADRCWGPIIFG
jgi:hypothetical protein